MVLTVGCFDVYYSGDRAWAAGIVFVPFPQERALAQYRLNVAAPAAYVPGQFYRRELPCLLHLYFRIGETLDLIIIDGYVWLATGKKGLGAHLFSALGAKIPVIGVAKTYYHGCDCCRPVLRGQSQKPLYVSSVGLDLAAASEIIEHLGGRYRIPDMLKKVDRLSRGLV